MRYAFLTLLFTCTLAACGGGKSRAPAPTAPTQFASGPIGNACLSGGRQSATRALCGCVQAAADISLGPQDQKRGAKFFSDQVALQNMKLSDTPSSEAFWKRWATFSELAEGMCGSV